MSYKLTDHVHGNKHTDHGVFGSVEKDTIAVINSICHSVQKKVSAK